MRLTHTLAQLCAEAVHQPVVGAHPLHHDLGRHANHVRVADPPPLDDGDNVHAGAELPFLRLHAEDAGVGVLERVDDLGWNRRQRPRRHVLDQNRTGARSDGVQREGQAGGHFRAGAIGDQRHLFARRDAETHFHGIASPGRELGGRGTKEGHGHRYYSNWTGREWPIPSPRR